MKRIVFLAAAAVGALVVVYRFEDPFLRRWPSPRERKARERLIALHDEYGQQGRQPWA